MKSNLLKRVITALIGGSAFVAVLVLGERWGALALAELISIAMIIEYGTITLGLPDRTQKIGFLVASVIALDLVYAWHTRYLFEGIVLIFVAIFMFFLFTAYRHPGEKLVGHNQELMSSFFGVIYVGALPLFLPELRSLEHGLIWTILFFVINWTGDTAAYFAGKALGKRKLYELISPKKTWVGAVAALLGSVVIAELARRSYLPVVDALHMAVIVVIVSAAAQAGDLCESLIKRANKIKDSGGLLPGHGGFLDRFDGVTLSLPVMFYCVKFLA